MSVKSDIDYYGRRVAGTFSGDAERAMRNFSDAVEKLAGEVERLETKVARLEGRLR